MLRDACYILDLEKVPPMYVTQNPQPNAMCIGLDEPIIVVTTGLVELLDEEEMRAVVGHEVGHALSGHSVYRTILLFLTNLALKVAWIPLGNLAIMAIVTALREWFRKSELSADRAGLLVGQDLQASMRGLMKIAGGNHLHEMNVDAFLRAGRGVRGGRATCATRCSRSSTCCRARHPFTTVRAAELKKWARVPRLPADHGRPLPAARRGQGHLGHRLVPRVGRALRGHGQEPKDPLMKLVGDIAGGAGDLGGKLRRGFGGFGGPAPSDDRRVATARTARSGTGGATVPPDRRRHRPRDAT